MRLYVAKIRSFSTYFVVYYIHYVCTNGLARSKLCLDIISALQLYYGNFANIRIILLGHGQKKINPEFWMTVHKFEYF